MKKYFLFFLFINAIAQAQQLAPLSVQKIMRDPKWMGTAPTNYRWSADSKTVFFNWNPENKEKTQPYKVSVNGALPALSTADEAEKAAEINYEYNADKSLGLTEKNGDIYLLNTKTAKQTRLNNTVERESNARFLTNNNVVFLRGNNLFELNLQTNELVQRSNFVSGKRSPTPSEKTTGSQQDNWLKNDQSQLFDIIKKREKQAEERKIEAKKAALANPEKAVKIIYTEDKNLNAIQLSPNGRYITYNLSTPPVGAKNTIMPNYVTASGYTEDTPTRTKVGDPQWLTEGFVFDTQKDTVYSIHTEQILGIKDLPDYVKDYPKQLAERTKKNEDRKVNISSPIWNKAGTQAIIVASARDNKDLWILKLDVQNGNLSLIDRQTDNAWIGGPGIGARGLNWLDNDRFYYQSEATGYSHLYVCNFATGEKKQLTFGNWEVQSLQLSKDKTTFYIAGNKEHPGITHFYKMSVNGGELSQITSLKGGNEVTLSPDEKWLAINYSFMDKPWELYIQANKPGAKAVQITKSTTPEFDSYQWRKPDLVTFKNRYGNDVYARVYSATNPHPNKPAVVFVHGAGYLQNVHYWWSQYFREYMFNNLLADNGYTVIDIDYTASSGYGRNHRTGIYRHMGGKDLTDQVDGVKMLVEKYGVNPKHVGLYGGSYGGFITLMALFNEPEVFAAGAALRSVTDWAHYNHGYTANILNEPFNDEIAYKRSSPIYFANGLKGNLLMAHGMVDDNVHFQDIVRLSQRFIELGKNNWELAVYPIESHGFTEPSSWTDEYNRIFKLFETTLKK